MNRHCVVNMPDFSTSRPGTAHRRPVSGAWVLCRADPDDVRPSASLLPIPLVLAPAGAGWSVLVPVGPREPVGEPSDGAPAGPDAGGSAGAPGHEGTTERPGAWHGAAGGGPARSTGRGGGAARRSSVTDSDALTDLARTVAAGESWPVIGVWWGADGAGFTIATGFRRPVSFAWRADGTPDGTRTGAADAARALIARLGLDPVLDGAAMDELTGAGPGATSPRATGEQEFDRPWAGRGAGSSGGPAAEPGASLQQRLVGLVAVVSRAGLRLPDGLTPGAPEHRLCAAIHAAPGAETLVWRGWRDAVRAELDSLESGPRGHWLRGPRARALGAAQLAVGLPLAAWGLRRGRPGWALVGALLTVDGAAGLAYDGLRGR